MDRKWIEAAKILSKNPTEKVRCPDCGDSYLTVMDTYIAGASVFERHLKCDNCGSYNSMRMTYKEPAPETV